MLVATVGAIVVVSVFSFKAIPPRDAFVLDREMWFFLSKRTSEGALPLVDFQHGWNAGGWWVGALLYRLSGGNPNVFAFLFNHVFGRILSASLLATAVWRLRRSALLIPAVGIGSALWSAAVPPYGKYAIPAIWLFVLLPTGRLLRSRRYALAVHFALAFVTLWLHVELAIMLSAGVGLYELLGATRVSLASRVARVGALGAGVATGVTTEFLFYATQGVSPSTVNKFVFGGQATRFPEQYGWSLTDPPSSAAALFPLLLLLPFLPPLWRRAAAETRLASCLSLATAIVAIRRPDTAHVSAASTLFVFTLVLLADDVYRSGRALERRAPSLRRVGAAVIGCAWASAMLLVALEAESLFAAAVLMLGAAAAAWLARRGDWSWAAGGALAVLLVVPISGTGAVLRDRVRSTDPHFQIRANAEGIDTEVDRCLGDEDRALIAPTQLSLYDDLHLDNPTPYFQFHYDFARYQGDLVSQMQRGAVPALIETYPLPEWMAKVRGELDRAYVRCATVAVHETGNTITIWVERDRAPAEQRELRVHPDGTVTDLDAPVLSPTPPVVIPDDPEFWWG